MTYDDKSLSGADDARLPVTGAGGMGGKGGSSASTAPDTLFSTATVRLIDLLGEGEIRGVRGGLKGVYLNDVPVQNADGSFNFKGLTAEFRVGTPDQTYMAGYPDVQTPKDVGIKVNQATPVVVSISDTDVDRLRVTVQIPSLFLAKTDGAVKANTLNYRIEARYSGGPWVNSLGDLSLTGKTTSGYFRSHEIPLPRNPSGASAPWQVRVTRLTPDTDGYNNSQSKYTSQSDLIFASTTSIVDAKFSYPHSAMVGLTAQASSFGSSVPSRTYLVDGVLMPIPSNYDPATRAYTGIWDGTFKEGFTNNPAWALYLILRDDRFGLGEFIDVQAIDKWTLYDIARYCDTLVDDGKGGKEPRYTFNGSISSQQQAFELIQLIAQIFRGTVYWSSGSVTASQDRPGDPVLLVTEANVLDDSGFSYASSGRRARHTVALVAWNDPDNLYKQAIEVVEDADGVARYGYNPTRIDLLGCTSRGQAHRAGLWTLFTELHQTQVVTYKAGLDHAVARPGDVVAIQDPQIANLDLSGRLKAGSTTTELILDRNVDLTLATGYSVSVTLPDGKVEERAITNGIGSTGVVRLGTALSQTPDPAAVWLIAGPVEPQLFRIVSIHEEEPHVYAVSALQHEPGKYAAIDSGAAFEPTVISEFPTIVLPPKDLTVRESQYTERGQAKQGLTLSWTAGQPFNAVAHYVTVVRPSGAVVTSRTPSTSIDFLDAEAGEWKFTVVTQGLNGKSSLPAERTYTVVGWAGQAPTTVTGLSVKGGGDTFSGRSCTLTWTNKRADNVPPYPIRNVVYVFDASSAALLHREMLPVGQTEWTYDYQVNVNEGGPRRRFRVSVCALSVDEAEGPLASLLVSNPAPAIIVPTLSSTSETLFVELPKVTDPDFAGYLVWVSETAGINPVTAKSFEVQNNLFTFAGTPDKTYYVRAAAYDAFSKNPAELNVSIEQSKAITILLFDPTAPARPAAPTLVSTAETGIDGTLTSSVKATWPAVTSANLAYYEIAWQIASGDWQIRRVDTNAATERGFQPATVVNAKVRSVSKMGFVSSYGPVGTVTTNKSTVRPANPTNPSVSGKFQRITVTFTPPADKDLDYIEVWATDGISSALTPPMWATMVGRVPYGQTAYWDDMPTTGQRTYWLRSHNTSDLVAANYLLAGSAQTAALEGAQLAAGIIDATKMAASLEVPRVFESLPTTKTGQFVTLRSDGKLYRWDASQAKYVSDVDVDPTKIRGLTAEQIDSVNAAALLGQIKATQITDGAITSPKIQAGSIEGDRIAARTIVAGNIASGTLTSNEIRAGSVDADRLIANSITAAQIRAGAIGADQISAGAILADKIGVGLNTGNLLANSDAAAGLITYQTGGSNMTGGLLALRDDWCPPGMKTPVLYAAGTPASGQYIEVTYRQIAADGSYSNRIPVVGGQRYELSYYASIHRCTARLVYYFIDINGETISASDSAAGNVGGNRQIGTRQSLLAYPRVAAFVTAPSNAAYIVWGARMIADGSNDPYLFTFAWMMAKALPQQTQFSPYAPQSTTIIDGGIVATGTLNANRIIAGTITTDRLQAGSINVDTIAATGTISANKLKADVLTVGNITITGGTKLSSWATGTQINGGAIAANTISAERLDIRSRGVQAIDLSFEANKATRTVSWNAGHILYINDTGGYGQNDPVAGSVTFPGGYGWIYWIKGEDRLIGTTDPAPYMANPNAVQMANYDGAAGLNVINGGVIIDGTRISAGTITAGQIAANSIQTVHLAANSINGDRITAGTLAADKIAAGTITAGVIQVGTQGGQGLLVMEAFGIRPGRLYCRDLNSTLRGMFGYIGDFTGIANDFGLLMWNAEGKQILTTSGLGAGTVGDVQVSSLSASKINADSLSALSANLGTVTAGVARSADGKFVIDFNNKFIEMFD